MRVRTCLCAQRARMGAVRAVPFTPYRATPYLCRWGAVRGARHVAASASINTPRSTCDRSTPFPIHVYVHVLGERRCQSVTQQSPAPNRLTVLTPRETLAASTRLPVGVNGSDETRTLNTSYGHGLHAIFVVFPRPRLYNVAREPIASTHLLKPSSR